mmetsp:Transcript_28078/g.82611  ORF Transcript_28078/g.82611 Transcript_28078/m.82611 type:complete len:119 (-) Transcript_28078:505-861(-)
MFTLMSTSEGKKGRNKCLCKYKYSLIYSSDSDLPLASSQSVYRRSTPTLTAMFASHLVDARCTYSAEAFFDAAQKDQNRRCYTNTDAYFLAFCPFIRGGVDHLVDLILRFSYMFLCFV